MSDLVYLGKKPMRLTVAVDTIRLEIVCDGTYEAQVLYDDLLERFQAGFAIALHPGTGVQTK
jgi:hypothetical protein